MCSTLHFCQLLRSRCIESLEQCHELFGFLFGEPLLDAFMERSKRLVGFLYGSLSGIGQ